MSTETTQGLLGTRRRGGGSGTCEYLVPSAPTLLSTHTPSIAFRHLPPRKDVVNQFWEFVKHHQRQKKLRAAKIGETVSYHQNNRQVGTSPLQSNQTELMVYSTTCSFERNHTKYVDKYYTHHPSVPKFCSLMNMTSKSKNVKLAKFISCIFELFWLRQ